MKTKFKIIDPEQGVSFGMPSGGIKLKWNIWKLSYHKYLYNLKLENLYLLYYNINLYLIG